MTTDDPSPPSTSRRCFLKSIGFGAASGALPPVAVPVVPEALAPALLLEDSEVRGIRYHLTAEIVERLTTATRLRLCREPDNGHDPKAVAIELETGERIGYVPREQNGAMAALLDAGHDIRGEIVAVDRSEFETRLSGDGKPFPGRVILEELAADTDGARRVRMAELRPRFKAWLATGAAPDAKSPDPRRVADWPGWMRILPEFEPRNLFGQQLKAHAPAIQPGIQLLIEDRRALANDDLFFLFLPSGERIGSLTGAEAEALGRTIDAGLQVAVVITRVRREDDAPVDSLGWPWLDLRCLGEPPPPLEAAERARRDAERRAESDRRFQANIDAMVQRHQEDQRKYQRILSAIQAARSSSTQPPANPPDTPHDAPGLWLRDAANLAALGQALGLGPLLAAAEAPTRHGDDDGAAIRHQVRDGEGTPTVLWASAGAIDDTLIVSALADLSLLERGPKRFVLLGVNMEPRHSRAVEALNVMTVLERGFYGVRVTWPVTNAAKTAPVFEVLVAPKG